MVLTSGLAAVTVPFRRAGSRRVVLRVATVAVHQFSRGAARQADVGPVFEGVPGFEWWMQDTALQEFIPRAAVPGAGSAAGWDQFGHHTSVSRHRDTLAGVNVTNVVAQVVLQFTDTGFHNPIIATCSHNANGLRRARTILAS